MPKQVLSLRNEYQLGSWRIKWYLERYHDISISESSVSRILKRDGVERLQKKASRRALHSKRYNKSVPGHHVQVDVKVLLLKDLVENEYKRFQYTATVMLPAYEPYKSIQNRTKRMPLSL